MTNIILIFFALPLATIIISIALQRILKCPILVALVIFAIFLIVTFAVFDATFLVAAIIYAIIAFITAFLTCIISRLLRRINDCNCSDNCKCRDNCNYRNNTLMTTNLLANNHLLETSNDLSQKENITTNRVINNTLTPFNLRETRCSNSNNNGNLLTIQSNGCNGVTNDLLTISSNCLESNSENNSNCSCRRRCNCCNCNNTQDFVLTASVTPDFSTNGRTGSFRGCFRRRCC